MTMAELVEVLALQVRPVLAVAVAAAVHLVVALAHQDRLTQGLQTLF
jgi:hypothetical protein